MGFGNSWWNIPMSRSVILAAAIFAGNPLYWVSRRLSLPHRWKKYLKVWISLTDGAKMEDNVIKRDNIQSCSYISCTIYTLYGIMRKCVGRKHVSTAYSLLRVRAVHTRRAVIKAEFKYDVYTATVHTMWMMWLAFCKHRHYNN